MNVKKKLCSACLVVMYVLTIQGENTPFFEDPLIFGDGYGDLLTSEVYPAFRLPPEQVIGFLQLIGAIPILEEPLYLRSQPFNVHQLVDLPGFEPRPCPGRRPRFFDATFFYNETVRMYFGDHSSDMRTFLALDQTTLIEKIQQVLDSNIFSPLVDDPNRNINIRRILNLFARTTVTERRMGLMLQWIYFWDDLFTFRALAPLYWLERNFFLTPGELRLIEAEFGEADPQTQKRFQDRFLISDKFGFGDARLEWTWWVKNSPQTSLEVGLMATIPIAFPLAHGFRGHHFRLSSAQPNFDFNALYDLVGIYMNMTDPVAKEQVVYDILYMVKIFGEGALDRLSSILLESPLGNGGHTGIGFLLRTTSNFGALINKSWADPITASTRISLEYYFPATEKRFYAKNPALGQFALRNFNDDTQAQSNLDFLQQELVNRSYPIALDTRVQPGLLFRVTNHTCYTFNDRWRLLLGSDWWVQGRETLGPVYAPINIVTQITQQKAQKLFAYQSRLHGGVSYTRLYDDTGWAVSLYFDGTTISSGIGQDVTAYFSIDAYY